MTARASRHVVTNLVIFLAGFGFLVYEVSFNRILSLQLGTTVAAATIVLAAFMAGFGLGAMYLGRYINRSRSTGQLLGRLLIGIGILGVLDFLCFEHVLPALYAGASEAVGSGPTAFIALLLAAVLLCLPAFLMGGVFPAVSRIAVAAPGSVAATLGRLYALETLGSALGGLVTGFVLLGSIGQAATVGLAATLYAVTGAALLLRRFGATSDGADVETDKARQMASVPLAQVRRATLIATFVCGFAIVGLQVLWMRAFRVYLTNTSYTFALVASLAILGLFVGSAIFRSRSAHLTDYPRALVRALLLMAAVTGAGLLVVAKLPHLLMFPFESLLEDPAARVFGLPAIASLLIVFPPAVISGFAFPLACRLYASGRESIAGEVGRVLMVNTAGSVIGPIVAAFILIPGLGAARAIALVVAVLAATAAYLLTLWRTNCSDRTANIALGTGTVALLVLVVLAPHIRILPPSFARADREILFYRESVEGTLSVGRGQGTGLESKQTFVNNSAVIGSTYDAIKVVKMVGHFPFFLGLEGRDVLVIGFGIGVTTSAIAAHPEVESIECVELVTGLKDAAVFYENLNHRVAHDPRVRMIAGDGRHYLQLSPRKYDLISCDPTHPILGSGNLYTRDYFELCREHLTPGGMVSQYMPLHKLRTEEFLGIIATLESVFPHCTVWLGHYHAVLLGSMEPIEVSFREWSDAIAELGADPHFYSNPYHLAATLVLDGDAILRLGAASRINTDNLCYTEFFHPDCLDPDNLVRNLEFLNDSRCDLSATIHSIPDPAMMARFLAGNQLLSESLAAQLRGDRQAALEKLRQATAVNPEDQEFPFLIRLNY